VGRSVFSSFSTADPWSKRFRDKVACAVLSVVLLLGIGDVEGAWDNEAFDAGDAPRTRSHITWCRSSLLLRHQPKQRHTAKSTDENQNFKGSTQTKSCREKVSQVRFRQTLSTNHFDQGLILRASSCMIARYVHDT